MSKKHAHACHQCGDIFTHATDHDATSEQFDKAHTCANGHSVTVKYLPDVAARMSEICKAGGDVLAYLKTADPAAFVTLEASQDPELSAALDDLQNAGPFMGTIILDRMAPALQDKVAAYAEKLHDALADTKGTEYDIL